MPVSLIPGLTRNGIGMSLQNDILSAIETLALFGLFYLGLHRLAIRMMVEEDEALFRSQPFSAGEESRSYHVGYQANQTTADTQRSGRLS